MSDFCSVLNQKRANLLAFGYLRRKQKKYHLSIPTDLTSVCLKFFHDVIEWKFTDSNLTQFYEASQRGSFEGQQFKIHDLAFKLTVFPRYRGWTFQNDAEYVALFFELDRKSLPSQVQHILVYFILYLEEYSYEYRHIAKLSKSNHDIMWYTPTVQFRRIKERKFKQLSFGCYAEVLRICYHDEPSSDDDGDSDSFASASSLTQRVPPLPKYKYFTMNTRILSEYVFEWNLNDNELARFKHAATDYSLYSSNFNGDCFCIVCSPNGLSVVKQSEGLIFLKIKLLKMPCNINKLSIEYELKLETQGASYHKFIHKETREYAYDKTGDNVKDDLMKLSSMAQVDGIRITAKIRVLKAFVNEKNEEIKKEDWLRHGIIAHDWK
mmetsp:Transcript_8410/g.13820  ORF Transcript_8410/g.13820 Transcript_8410/m.13820 type:complete len:380 (+) Transcript_8410:36-1175(+)